MSTTAPDAKRPLTLDDLVALQTVSDPQIAPDGSRIAFVVETIDPAANEARTRIWLIDARDGATPRPLTNGERQDSQPRWSPDGKTLAFISNRGGNRQVWRLPLDGGEARRLTDHPGGAREPSWAPDGNRLAFIAPGPDRRDDPLELPEREDRRRLVRVRAHRHKLDGRGYFGPAREHVWMVNVTSGKMTQLTDGPYDDADPAWSPDGSRIAFAANRSPDNDSRYGGSSIHLVDVRSGEVRALGSAGRRGAHPACSPDGDWIAYPGSLADDDAAPATTRLWIERADNGEARCLTADLAGSVGHRPGGYLSPSAPAWSPGSASLLYLLGDGPATQLARFSAAGIEALTSGRHVVQTFTADASNQRVALLVTDSTSPSEVWLWDENGARPLTQINAPLLEKVSLAEPTDLQITRPDRTVVDGWLLVPPARDGPLPLILSIHGGPHNYFGDTFSFDHQLFATLGYAVLSVNPRGSGGQTEDFARTVLADWGGADFADLMAMLDHVIERSDPPIDPARLGIFGHSYGGYMTCWAVTQTNRFAAAVSGACIANLVSFYGTSDIGASWGEREFGGTPFERQEWYEERSPLSHAERVTTPLLLYHGETDLRCPIEQSEQMFSALHRLGKTVELLRVPQEPHGVLNGSPVHRIEVRRAIVEWFQRHLSSS